MEDRGLTISRKNPLKLRFNVDRNLDGNSDINIQGENLEKSECIRISSSDIGRELTLGCGDDAYNTIGMETLEECIGILCDRIISSRESIQDGCKTSNDVPCRDMGSEESTRELDVAEMRMSRWMSGVTKLDRIRSE